MPGKKTVAGWFEYRAAGNGWEDTFRVVDDDGMPFVLSDLRAFEGLAVKITIELDPESEARSQADISREPYIYRKIGMTRDEYRKTRTERRRLGLRP